MILFIDPGLRGVGAALFLPEGKLSVATYVKNPVASGRGYNAHFELARQVFSEYGRELPIRKLVIEHPVIYPGMASKRDGENPDDLLDVVAVGAGIATFFGHKCAYNNLEIVTVKPAEWKGNMPKEKMTERIRAKAEARGEMSRIVALKSIMHNVLDAYGIGLWYFDALNTKVYPGATP